MELFSFRTAKSTVVVDENSIVTEKKNGSRKEYKFSEIEKATYGSEELFFITVYKNNLDTVVFSERIAFKDLDMARRAVSYISDRLDIPREVKPGKNLIKRYNTLLNKRDKYVGMANGSDYEEEIAQLFDAFGEANNRFANAIIDAPLQTKKAVIGGTGGAILGTIAGGVSTGILAGTLADINAKEKGREYRESLKNVIDNKVEQAISGKNVDDIYFAIMDIAEQIPAIIDDWNDTLKTTFAGETKEVEEKKKSQNLKWVFTVVCVIIFIICMVIALTAF